MDQTPDFAVPLRGRGRKGQIDLVLLGIAAISVGVGAVLVRFYPTSWGCYLLVLDVQVWPPWKCPESLTMSQLLPIYAEAQSRLVAAFGSSGKTTIRPQFFQHG